VGISVSVIRHLRLTAGHASLHLQTACGQNKHDGQKLVNLSESALLVCPIFPAEAFIANSHETPGRDAVEAARRRARDQGESRVERLVTGAHDEPIVLLRYTERCGSGTRCWCTSCRWRLRFFSPDRTAIKPAADGDNDESFAGSRGESP